MPIVTRSQAKLASLEQEAIPLNAKGYPCVGGLTIPPATPVVKKRKVQAHKLDTLSKPSVGKLVWVKVLDKPTDMGGCLCKND
jgi:hypothetical protein